jgi:uncharacterized protein YlxW (UPF0749 family)
LGTTALLVDLVTNTLDPGYAAASARRAGRRSWYDRPLVALGCLLIGFTAVVGYVHTNRSAPAAAKVHSDLVNRVRTAQRDGSALESSAAALGAQIDAQRNAALAGSDKSLTNNLARSELLAGATAVHGPGVRVSLADAPTATASPSNGRPGSTPITATAQLTDQDVRSVVNELWTDGAEAISVNDIRLTPTSAIRFAGEAVLVDFRPITSPYTIRAIGNADMLVTSFADSDVASRYQTLTAARGISFSFDEEKKLDLPASPLVNPIYARPAAATPSPGATR